MRRSPSLFILLFALSWSFAAMAQPSCPSYLKLMARESWQHISELVEGNTAPVERRIRAGARRILGFSQSKRPLQDFSLKNVPDVFPLKDYWDLQLSLREAELLAVPGVLAESRGEKDGPLLLEQIEREEDLGSVVLITHQLASAKGVPLADEAAQIIQDFLPGLPVISLVHREFPIGSVRQRKLSQLALSSLSGELPFHIKAREVHLMGGAWVCCLRRSFKDLLESNFQYFNQAELKVYLHTLVVYPVEYIRILKSQEEKLTEDVEDLIDETDDQLEWAQDASVQAYEDDQFRGWKAELCLREQPQKTLELIYVTGYR